MTANPFLFLLLWLFIFMGCITGFFAAMYVFLPLGVQIGQLKKLPLLKEIKITIGESKGGEKDVGHEKESDVVGPE